MGAKVYDFVRQQVGFYGRDAITFDALHAVECLHQVEESLTGAAAEVANVHARDNNFFSPLGSHGLSLRHQRCDGAVSAFTAGNGDGSIGAIVVATVLHFQKIARAVAA